MAAKPDRPELPPQRPRDPPKYAGEHIVKTCSNCQHFKPSTTSKNKAACHNGISGRLETRPIDGCAYGFYPDTNRFPLQAGPGGIR
mgnify:CR=1 FL=1